MIVLPLMRSVLPGEKMQLAAPWFTEVAHVCKLNRQVVQLVVTEAEQGISN